MRSATLMHIAFSEAEEIVRETGSACRTDSERVLLSRARGRILSEAQFATMDMPPFHQSSMDGYAVRCADVEAQMPLQVIGEQRAGADVQLVVGKGETVAVFTGSVLPQGADSVLIKENAVRRDAGPVFGTVVPTEGKWVRLPGEDMRRGELLFHAGHRLASADIGVLAACGLHDVLCARRPIIALFTLGDELAAPGASLARGMVYDSNRAMLMSFLAEEGFEPLAWPILRDDPEVIASALRDAAVSADLLLTCGGVSVGTYDHLPKLMEIEGETIFHKIRCKPGGPVLFGRFGSTLWLGLPGNPVSTLAMWLCLGRALVDAMQGAAAPRPLLRARLRSAFVKNENRAEFMRGTLACGSDGQLWAEADLITGSHRIAAAARNNALLVLPEGTAEFEEGCVIEAIPFGPLGE